MKIHAFASCLGVVSLAVLPVPAYAAKEPLRLPATSKWQIDYADDSCRLARGFGEGEDQSVLIMDRFQPGDGFKLIVAGKPFKNLHDRGDAKIRFGPIEQKQEVGYFHGDLGDKPAMILAHAAYIGPASEAEQVAAKKFAKDHPGENFEFSPIDPAREAAVAYVSVDAPGVKEIVLETGSMKGPMAALSRCTDELLEHWGVDVAAHKSLTRKPAPIESPAKWITHRDYPATLVSKGTQSIVQFRLDVDSSGKPTGCHIQTHTKPADFNEVVCAVLMKRAEFLPALDAAGQPLASYYINSVVFQIGE